MTESMGLCGEQAGDLGNSGGPTLSGECSCCVLPDLVMAHSNSLDHTSMFRNGTDFLAICEQVRWTGMEVLSPSGA